MIEYIKTLFQSGEPFVHYFNLFWVIVTVSAVLVAFTIAIIVTKNPVFNTVFGITISALCGLAGFTFTIKKPDVENYSQGKSDGNV